jgi:hypothetical protein
VISGNQSCKNSRYLQNRFKEYLGYSPIYEGDRTWRNYWECTFTQTGCEFGFPRVSWLRVSIRTNTTKGATAEAIEDAAQLWDDPVEGWVAKVQQVCTHSCHDPCILMHWRIACLCYCHHECLGVSCLSYTVGQQAYAVACPNVQK